MIFKFDSTLHFLYKPERYNYRSSYSIRQWTLLIIFRLAWPFVLLCFIGLLSLSPPHPAVCIGIKIRRTGSTNAPILEMMLMTANGCTVIPVICYCPYLCIACLPVNWFLPYVASVL